MPYVKNVWTDNVTPVDASRMTNIENGIFNAEEKANKNIANGYAGLDANGRLLVAQHRVPYFRFLKTANQTIPASALTPVSFDLVVYDSDASGITSTTRYTIKTAGLWHLHGTLAWTASTTGERACSIKHSSGNFVGGTIFPAPGSAGQMSVTVADGIWLASVNDWFEVNAYENGVGGGVNINPSFGTMGINTDFWGYLVSAV